MLLILSLLTLLFFAGFYIAWGLLYFTTYRWAFVILVLIMYSMNDYIFVNLTNYISPEVVGVIKWWKEIALFYLLILYFLKRPRDHGVGTSAQVWYVLVIVALSLECVLVGASGGSLSEVVKNWREYFYPAIFSFVLYKSGLFDTISLKAMVYTLLVMTSIMVIYCVIQIAIIGNDYTALWYYKFSVGRMAELGNTASLASNYIRNDRLRSSGFFVSPIEFSAFCGINGFLALACLFRARHIYELLLLIFALVTALYGILLSQTRVGIILVLCCVVVFLMLRITKSLKLAFIVPLFATVATLVSLVLWPSDFDLSAYGRFTQYVMAFSSFKPFGYGVGHEGTVNATGLATGELAADSVTFMDSWFLSSIGVLGFGVLFYIWLTYAPCIWLWRGLRSGQHSPATGDITLCYAVVAVTIAYSYVLAFQYSMNAVGVNLFALLGFAGVAVLSRPASQSLEVTSSLPLESTPGAALAE